MTEARFPEARADGPLVKVCGVTTVEDARMCAAAGVDAIGLNFWPGSKRYLTSDAARRIAQAIAGEVTVVALFVDEPVERIEALRTNVGFEWVQLHGNESPADLARLGPKAYKALRVSSEAIVVEADRYEGELLLLDAFVPGAVGGTGQSFDWDLAAKVAAGRVIGLAGGLRPDNVREAVDRVRPRLVDVASGVESAPGRKDEASVAAFVAAARRDV